METIVVIVENGKVVSIGEDASHEAVGRSIEEYELELQELGFKPFFSMSLHSSSDLEIKSPQMRSYSRRLGPSIS